MKLVPNEQVVEVDDFETADPALRREMTITITLPDAEGGTDVLAEHEGLPPGVSPADNEMGTTTALAKLATLVETGQLSHEFLVGHMIGRCRCLRRATSAPYPCAH